MGKIESWLSGLKLNPEHLAYYLAILFLPTQLGRHFWPSFSYLYGIRIDYLSPTVYLTDVLIILLFVFWLKRLLKRISFRKFMKFLTELVEKKFFLLLFPVLIILSINISHSPLAGWYGFFKLIEFIFFGYYTSIFINKSNFSKILILFSATIMAESLLAVFQFINKSSLGGIFYFFGERAFNGQTPAIANASLDGILVLRPYATFSHPNVLAGYLLITMIFLIYYLGKSDGKEKIFLASGFFFGTIGLFLSMSRIAIVLWLILLIIHVIKNTEKARYLFLIIFSALTFGILTTPIGSRFFTVSILDPGLTTRLELIKNSILLIIKNPIFGLGLNNFIPSLSEINFQGNIFYFQPVHNIFLLVGLQIGLLGLLFFFWFIYKTYQKVKPTIYDLRFTALSCILILGFFDHYFLTLQQGQMLFSFVLGICWIKDYNI